MLKDQAIRRQQQRYIVLCTVAVMVLIFVVLERPDSLRGYGDERQKRAARFGAIYDGADAFQTINDESRSSGDLPVDESLVSLRAELQDIKRPLQQLIDKLEEETAKFSTKPTSSPGVLAQATPQPVLATRLPKANLPPHHKLDFHYERGVQVLVILLTSGGGRCHEQIDHMFENAEEKRNIKIAIVEQIASDDTPCLDERTYFYCNQSSFCASDHVRYRRVPPSEGVLSAMALGSSLFRREHYVMVLRHEGRVGFPPKWDTLAINSWTKAARFAKSNSVVLSMRNEGEKTRACKIVFGATDLDLPDVSATFVQGTRPVNLKAPYASADFIFAKGELLEDINLDHDLFGINSGQDLLLTAQLISAGYSVFQAPTGTVTFTPTDKVYQMSNNVTTVRRILKMYDAASQRNSTSLLKVFFTKFRVNLTAKTSREVC